MICPVPSWKIVTNSSTGECTKEPVLTTKENINDEKALEKHNIEVDLIIQYSPFKSEEDLLCKF